MGKGNSFANGQAMGNGGSYSTGPWAGESRDGWPPCTTTHWDLTEPRTYT